MQIQIPADALHSTLTSILGNALSAEQQLSQAAQSQVQALVAELYPLVVSETQAAITATNPAIPEAYLGILSGCVAAAVAKLGLQALTTQRTVIAGALQTSIQVLALVLKAAVAA